MPASRGQLIGATPVSAWQMQQEWSATTHLCIRAARMSDLEAMSEILTSSFHRKEGWLGWAYPLLRLGVQEDLRTRLRSEEPHRLCLVAAEQQIEQITTSDQGDSSQPASDAEGTQIFRTLAELSMGRAPHITRSTTIAGTVEISARQPSIWQTSRRQLYLSNLAIAPHYRRQGVAQSLLQACEQVAQAWGFQEIYLHVLEHNLAARRLYRKLGYRLEQVDCGLDHWLMAQPRQFLLKKSLLKKIN